MIWLKEKKMDHRTVLSKIAILIYRTRILESYDYDSLIQTVLDTIKTDSPEFNFQGHNIVKNFKETCVTLLQEKELIPKEVLIPQFSILLETDQKLFAVLKEAIEQDHDDATNKRIVTNLVKTLNNYYREQLAITIINKVSYDIKFNRAKIGNFSDYLKNTITELEPLTTAYTSIKDPALVNEIDFENPDTLNTVFEEVKNLNNNTGIYKLGWQSVNKMLQGGIRRGEFVTIGALQHKYKTGLSLSMFMQIALHNVPIVTKEESEVGKKPLLLRISFEDSLTNNLQFMYQYLKATEGQSVVSSDFDSIPAHELSKYILSKLTKNGFHIKMLRVDPSQWTYSSIISKVLELEAQGYSVHLLMLDYLTLIPTTGCTQGPIGADKRDLIRRMRNFCSARSITCITPLQLSSEAKMLVRNGVPEHQLVNEIADKGYYDGAKSLDQEIDLELYLHCFNHKRKKYIAIRRGKHRIPTVIAEEDKYVMYRFPNLNTPVLEDLDAEDSGFTKLPKDFEDGTSDILSQVLS